MNIFKRKSSLKRRVAALEGYLGLVYAKDEYDDFEHFEKKWGFIPETKKDIEKLSEGKKK